MLKYFLAVVISTLTTVGVMAQPNPKAVPFFKNARQFAAKSMFNDAIVSYKKAIAIDKKYDSANLELSSLFLKISMNDSAIAVLKRAVKIKPAFIDAHILLGIIYRDYTRNSDEAIVNFLNAYKIDSANKLILYSLAWCNNDKGYFREAIKYGIKALDIDNGYRPAYNELAHAYRSLKAYQEAIDQFQKNIAISVNEQPLYYSGLCYLELNDKAGAEKMYEALKKINSKSADALRKKIDTKQ
jgi:tetratricopeptide (TPR) repeat protein